MFKLIIDNREKYVIRHADILAKVNHTQAQLTVGDYVITYRDNDAAPERIFAVFERKTLEDYASSMKDGRSDNKNKLLQLRDETNCKIFYIIEGAAYPAPGATFARTPYYYIQSSIFHLQIEYDIHLMQTRDTLHTAETLVAFMHSMANLHASRGAIFKTFHLNLHRAQNPDNTAGGDDKQPDVMQVLTTARPRTDNEILRSMWACFKYITVETAAEFMYNFTLADIFRGVITKDALTALKTSTGRALTTRVIDSLLRTDSHRNARILACVPGISESRAKDILKQHTLRQLLSYSAGAISIIKVGLSRKNLGEMAANNILKYFNLKPAVCGADLTAEDARVDVNAVAEATGDAAVNAVETAKTIKPRAARRKHTDAAQAPLQKPQKRTPKAKAKAKDKKINNNQQTIAKMSDEC
ncbi:DNA repair nuclease [Faustovirus]|nr:DNA repair nuclease [Faustovirus]